MKIAYFATKNKHKKIPVAPGSQKWNEKGKENIKILSYLNKQNKCISFAISLESFSRFSRLLKFAAVAVFKCYK